MKPTVIPVVLLLLSLTAISTMYAAELLRSTDYNRVTDTAGSGTVTETMDSSEHTRQTAAEYNSFYEYLISPNYHTGDDCPHDNPHANMRMLENDRCFWISLCLEPNGSESNDKNRSTDTTHTGSVLW